LITLSVVWKLIRNLLIRVNYKNCCKVSEKRVLKAPVFFCAIV